MSPAGFPPAMRLKRRAEFLRVQGRGRKHQLEGFIVFSSRATDPERPPRIGITVTRKVGNAVRRNRIRRLVREGFRRNAARFASGTELVFIAKRSVPVFDLGMVERDLERLLQRLERGSKIGTGDRHGGRTC